MPESPRQPNVVLIGGSPSADSRSQRLLVNLQERLTVLGVATRIYVAREFPASALLTGDTSGTAIQEFVETVKAAAAIVLGTPVYKATYTGGLKALVDVIPPDALVGKTALGLATAREPAHFATTGRAFEDLFAFFRVGRIVPPAFLVDEQVRMHDGVLSLGEAAARALAAAAEELADRAGATAKKLPAD